MIFLFFCGLLAGTMNAVAGGGSFVTFPALVYTGMLPIVANVTSTVALFPGQLASSWAYRHDLTGIAGVPPKVLFPVSLAGGLTGAILLLVTPGAAFDSVIPWLLLLATLIFAAGRNLGVYLHRFIHIGRGAMLLLQFIIGIYGGYFGGAVGLMMMAVWSLVDTAELKDMAAARILMVGAANGMAVICFIFAGAVRWPEMFTMLVAAVIGGYGGARFARHLPAKLLRIAVVTLSAIVTIGFFARKY